VEVNNAYCRLSGYTREELLGQPSMAPTPPEEVASAQAAFAKILAGGGYLEEPTERLLRRRGETVIQTEVREVLLTGEDGRPLVLSMVTDTTTRPEDSMARRETEMRYRLLFEQSPDGIVILDPATARFIEFNETAPR